MDHGDINVLFYKENFFKAKINLCNAGADANADAEMPMSRFPNGPICLHNQLKFHSSNEL